MDAAVDRATKAMDAKGLPASADILLAEWRALCAAMNGAVVGGWRSMNDAPRWVQVIVWDPNGGLRVGANPPTGIARLCGCDMLGRWIDKEQIYPTAWLPLPPPPSLPMPQEGEMKP